MALPVPGSVLMPAWNLATTCITRGVTLSPEVIARITEGDLARRFFTPLPEIADATPMPIPVMPSPLPEETAEVTPEPEDEDGIDPELAAILGLIETLAGL